MNVLQKRRRPKLPCWTIQSSEVSFDLEHTDINLLKLALEGLGYNVIQNKEGLLFNKPGITGTYNATTGKINADVRSGLQLGVNEVKRAYSKEIVRFTAKKFGWSISGDLEKGKVKVKKRF